MSEKKIEVDESVLNDWRLALIGAAAVLGDIALPVRLEADAVRVKNIRAVLAGKAIELEKILKPRKKEGAEPEGG